MVVPRSVLLSGPMVLKQPVRTQASWAEGGDVAVAGSHGKRGPGRAEVLDDASQAELTRSSRRGGSEWRRQRLDARSRR